MYQKSAGSMIIAEKSFIKLTIRRTVKEIARRNANDSNEIFDGNIYSTRRSSTSNVKVAFGGMMPGCPLAPYA
jgi:hypothetical protein